jgi:hypothetical protein
MSKNCETGLLSGGHDASRCLQMLTLLAAMYEDKCLLHPYLTKLLASDMHLLH